MTLFTYDTIQSLDKRKRANLINAIGGYKSANVVGSINTDNQTNLAVFSSVVHLGADPALIGLVSRPHVVPRHTLENIESVGTFTINHISLDFYKQAHLSSARTDSSEFDLTGLTPQFIDSIPAPFVAEAEVKIGLNWVRTIPITENNTQFIIGAIQTIDIPESAILDNGDINYDVLNTVAVTGLYTYHRAQQLETLPYAKAPS